MTEQLFKDIYDEELAKDAIINDRMEGFRQDYLVLHCLLRKYNIKSCFEVGTHTGMGALIIKNAMGNDSALFSLDLPDELYHVSKQHPLSEGKKGVGFECNLPFVSLRGDSRTFCYEQFPCEAFWIDGEHTAENVEYEVSQAMKSGTRLIILHDTDMIEVREGLYKAISKSYTHYKLHRVIDTRISYLINKEYGNA